MSRFRRHFGSGYIKGKINKSLTADFLIALGKSIGLYLVESGKKRERVIIAHDTRRSAHMVVDAISAGIASFGVDVEKIGLLPIPVVSFLSRALNCSIGIASSCPGYDFSENGVRIFNGEGEEIAQEVQDIIENFVENQHFVDRKLQEVEEVGRIYHKDYSGLYIEYMKSSFNIDKSRSRIAVDFRNGSFSKIGREILEHFSQVEILNDNPDGLSLKSMGELGDITRLKRTVKENGFDLGLSFDYKGERILVVDGKGEMVSGDKVFALLALLSNNIKRVAIFSRVNKSIVGYLENHGIEITDIEDRENRYKIMKSDGILIGSTAGGKEIFLEHVPMPDAMYTALKLIEILQEQNVKIEDMLNDIPEYFLITSQLDISAEHREAFVNNPMINCFIQSLKSKFIEGEGIDVKISPSENKIRILGGAYDKKRAYDIAYMCKSFIKRELNIEE